MPPSARRGMPRGVLLLLPCAIGARSLAARVEDLRGKPVPPTISGPPLVVHEPLARGQSEHWAQRPSLPGVPGQPICTSPALAGRDTIASYFNQNCVLTAAGGVVCWCVAPRFLGVAGLRDVRRCLLLMYSKLTTCLPSILSTTAGATTTGARRTYRLCVFRGKRAWRWDGSVRE